MNQTTMRDAFPLDWPVGYKRTRIRYNSRFKVTMDTAQRFLRAEVSRLGGTGLIVSTNLPVRNDGGLYADWMRKKVDDPGVAIYFKRKGKEIALCCDQYPTVWENIYALGKGIEAMRALERWGVSDFLDRAFTGFTALPESIITPESWWQVLGISPDASEEEIKSAYRQRAKDCHPDAGGTAERFQQLQQAYSDALEQIKQMA